MKVIGFAGTAKNTGKTTTVLSVMTYCRARSYRMALTSIGYDGEQRDTITSLPKPRYLLQPGDRVATARECLDAGSSGLNVLRETGLRTILGEIVIAEVTRAGMVLVAGPNRRKDLESLIQLFQEMDTDLFLVDGALNRLAPMAACSGLVLSTGAAYSNEIEKVSRHAAELAQLFNLEIERGAEMPAHGSQVLFEDGSSLNLPSGSLLEPFASDIFADRKISKILLPGLVSPLALQQTIDGALKVDALAHPFTVIMTNSLKIAASGHLDAWSRLIESSEVLLKVMHSFPLLTITVCPFFPRWLPRGREYEPAFVDADALFASVRSSVPSIPVLDVVRRPNPDWSEILQLERK